MKASYTQRPAELERMPDGYSKFRFDITDKSEGDKQQFECREVNIPGAVTSDKVIEAVMAEKWGKGIENKLINDYNEWQLTGENAQAKTEYESFLAERKALKLHIKTILGETV